ncbi:MAG: hypothetical protein WEC59_08475 [Salibacteraceae bacterium]
MSKKLIWKAFEAHEDQAEYVQMRYDILTVEKRIKRFFDVWDMIRALNSSKHQCDGFALKRNK